ncbi:MAG: hypothetical protein ACLUEV_10760 [Alistipes sp.]
MASLRGIKNDIDYLVSEVISDCYMALYFNDQSKRGDRRRHRGGGRFP